MQRMSHFLNCTAYSKSERIFFMFSFKKIKSELMNNELRSNPLKNENFFGLISAFSLFEFDFMY